MPDTYRPDLLGESFEGCIFRCKRNYRYSNQFVQVLGLWVLFALPVWSAAYKQAGAQNPEWTGASHVLEDIPGLGLVTRAAPEWDGPVFCKSS